MGAVYALVGWSVFTVLVYSIGLWLKVGDQARAEHRRRFKPSAVAISVLFMFAALGTAAVISSQASRERHDQMLDACVKRCAPNAAVACGWLNLGPEEQAPQKREYSICLSSDADPVTKMGDRR